MDLTALVTAAVQDARADGIKATIDLDSCNPFETDVWRCGQCQGINIQCWLWDYLPEELQPCNEIANGHGSAFESVCGCCGASMVPPDSILLAECFTHVEPSIYG